METWELYQDNVLLGQIAMTNSDFPWRYGTLLPTAAFASVKPLFDAAQVYIDADDYESPESDAAFQALQALGLSIRDVDSDEYFSEVLIWIDNLDASWRC